MNPRYSVRASRTIAASPHTVFNLLADPRRHAQFDGSGSLRGVRVAPERLFLGATFAMNMKIGLAYFTRNHVVVFEDNRAIAWHHFARCVWRYDLEDVGGATRVTESFTCGHWAGPIVRAMGFLQRNRRSMTATLERIDQLLTSSR